MTEVTLTPAALNYVRGHGKNVMLINGYRSGCCGGRVQVPSITLGVPENQEKYRQVNVEDCVSWIPFDLEIAYIEVDLAKLWIFEKLVVKTDEEGGVCVE